MVVAVEKDVDKVNLNAAVDEFVQMKVLKLI